MHLIIRLTCDAYQKNTNHQITLLRELYVMGARNLYFKQGHSLVRLLYDQATLEIIALRSQDGRLG